MQTRGLNARQLKTIATVAMAIQHMALLFLPPDSPYYWPLVSLGHITAPIMCFFIAEGYCHTHDRRRYALRLLLGAGLSHMPHALAFGFPIYAFWRYTSIFWSLFLGLMALSAAENTRLPGILRFLIPLACCVLAYPGNWNCIAVIWILGFGLFREAPVKKWGFFLLGLGVYVLEFFVISNTDLLLPRFSVLAAIPLLLCYNGQRGDRSALSKWGFYAFYPTHLLALHLIQAML